MRNGDRPHRADHLIAGGGIGGLTAALALARHGHAVHVLERHATIEELGFGIQLGPNATRVLDELGLLDSLIELGHKPSSLLLRDARDGQPITSVDLGEEFVQRYGSPYVVVLRSDLQSRLLAACESEPLIEINTGRDVQEIDDRGDAVTVVCAGGETYEASMVVAADGLRSRVRSAFTDDEIHCDGHVAYRGTLPAELAKDWDHLDSMVYWVGPGGHAVQYRVGAGALVNMVAVFHSPRFDAGESDWGTPEEFDAHYATFCEPLRLAALQLPREHRYPMLDRDPSDRWVSNRVGLLGDAAHPMFPFLAQGGCQAIEDAAVLAEVRSAHDEVADALKAYEAIRAPRAAEVQTMARRFGDVCHIDGVGVELRNALFRQHDPKDFEPLDWLYGRQPVAAA